MDLDVRHKRILSLLRFRISEYVQLVQDSRDEHPEQAFFMRVYPKLLTEILHFEQKNGPMSEIKAEIFEREAKFVIETFWERNVLEDAVVSHYKTAK